MVLKVFKILTNLIGLGAEWASSAFRLYMRHLANAFLIAIAGTIVGAMLMKLALSLDSTVLNLFGFLTFALTQAYFAIISIPASATVGYVGKHLEIVESKLVGLTNLLYLLIISSLVILLDSPQKHPWTVATIASIFMVTTFATIVPIPTKRTRFFLGWSRAVFYGVVLALMIFKTWPEDVIYAINGYYFGDHTIQRTIGAIPREISYYINGDNRVSNKETNSPIEWMSPLLDETGNMIPKIGWVREKNSHYRIFELAPKVVNISPEGMAITPVTPDKVQAIITQIHKELDVVSTPTPPTTPPAKDVLQSEQSKPIVKEGIGQESDPYKDYRSISESAPSVTPVATALIKPSKNEKDILSARPTRAFIYKDDQYRPDNSIIRMQITDIQDDPTAKDVAIMTLVPLSIDKGVLSLSIDSPIPIKGIRVQKSGGSRLKNGFLGGLLGATIGALAGGKKGAVIGTVAGAGAGVAVTEILRIKSHGKTLEFPVGAEITIRLKN